MIPFILPPFLLVLIPLAALISSLFGRQVRLPPLALRGFVLVMTAVVFLFYPEQTQTMLVQKWIPEGLFRTSPTLLVDPISWTFSVGLLALCVMIMGVTPEEDQNQFLWAMVAAGFSLLSCLAANPITLLFFWTILNILEFLYLLPGQKDRSRIQAVVLPFAVHLLGIVLLAASSLVAIQEQVPLIFQQIPRAAVSLLLPAAFFHLRIWTPVDVYQGRESYGGIFRLLPSASAWMIITRIAASEVGLEDPYLGGVFLAVLGVGAALAWNSGEWEGAGIRPWLIAFFALSSAGAFYGQETAGLIWAAGWLFAGSLPFLLVKDNLPAVLIISMGILAVSMLPYTPSWAGSKVFTMDARGLLTAAGYGLLLRGLVSRLIGKISRMEEGDLWGSFYPILGGVFLVIAHILVLFRLEILPDYFHLQWGSLPGMGIVLFLTITAFSSLLLPGSISTGFQERFGNIIRKGTTMTGQTVRGLFRLLNRFVFLFTGVVEGAGGVIWALLGAFFLISLLALWGGRP